MASHPAGSEATFWASVEYAGRFFMGDADVNRAMRKLVAALTEAKVPTPSSEPWRSASTDTAA